MIRIRVLAIDRQVQRRGVMWLLARELWFGGAAVGSCRLGATSPPHWIYCYMPRSLISTLLNSRNGDLRAFCGCLGVLEWVDGCGGVVILRGLVGAHFMRQTSRSLAVTLFFVVTHFDLLNMQIIQIDPKSFILVFGLYSNVSAVRKARIKKDRRPEADRFIRC